MKPTRTYSKTLLWSAMVVLISVVICVGILTNTTLRSIEKNLPNTLLSELQDLAHVLEDLATVVSLTKLAKIEPSAGNFARLRHEVKTVYESVVSLRYTYILDNRIQAFSFHAVVAPAVTDLQIWLSEGVSGYGPESETTANISLIRISDAYQKAKAMYHDSQIKAQNMLNEQRNRLDRFLYSANLLFIMTLGVTFCMILLLYRQHLLQKLETEARIERSRIEASLRETEKRFEEVAENINEVIWLYDREEQKVIYVSPAYERIWGRSIKSLYLRYDEWIESIYSKDLDYARKSFEDMLKSGSGASREYRIVRSDGAVRWISDRSFTILNDNGQVVRITGIAEDITDKKEADEALRESQEKIARSKKMESLGLLAGGVAHDLNNILSGIVGYPELLLLNLPGDSELRKPIETIHESGLRAAAIVQDLLTVARGVAIPKEPIRLNDLINDYLDSPEFKKLRQLHPTVTVKTALDDDLLNINGSYVHIMKLMMNLISNASEAIDGRGDILISTTNRYVDTPLRGYEDVKSGEYAVLSIMDQGSGISTDDMNRIFEPFYTKKVMGRSGTGLGLAVVWNVVQDHDGYINVKSVENVTTFEIFFPITRKEVSGRKLPTPIENYRGAGETILVVDDVEAQRDIACNMLGALGYKAKAVSSGEEAVDYLKEHTVDLILLDMIMNPGINGRETYERIIRIRPDQKAVIASGFAETSDVKHAQKLGAGRYIKKPLTLEKLGVAVKEELNG